LWCLQALALTLLRDIAAGMNYLHSRSVIHGDLKPGEEGHMAHYGTNNSSRMCKSFGCATHGCNWHQPLQQSASYPVEGCCALLSVFASYGGSLRHRRLVVDKLLLLLLQATCSSSTSRERHTAAWPR
jgi:hypothetical protein